MQLTKLKGTER